ncbi:hypothetical protein ElyMa_000037700 [Elysia marginata]|uniref:Uncharacterized protein n=1 Tax=Elysia marginata TaxID=1093978 RepID=A0AAV4EDB8_9GAST|nr:hypothetical protein ElyMa_000037700 [Elysia marginata]
MLLPFDYSFGFVSTARRRRKDLRVVCVTNQRVLDVLVGRMDVYTRLCLRVVPRSLLKPAQIKKRKIDHLKGNRNKRNICQNAETPNKWRLKLKMGLHNFKGANGLKSRANQERVGEMSVDKSSQTDFPQAEQKSLASMKSAAVGLEGSLKDENVTLDDLSTNV